MRKLGRILRRLLTALSLLLFVAVLAGWIYSSIVDVAPLWSMGTTVYKHKHDQMEWQRCSVVRLRPSHIAIEFWEIPRDDVAGFPAYLNTTYWADSHMAYEETYLGVLAWSHRQSGIAYWSYSRPGRKPVPATAPVNGRTAVCFRWWFLAILFASPGIWKVARDIATRLRPIPGRCGLCGYDLRASPQRCPECGTAVGQKDHHGVTKATEKTPEKSHR